MCDNRSRSVVPLLAVFMVATAFCSSCYSPGEATYLPAKAQKFKDVVVLSVITRTGQTVEFSDPGGRMHVRCRDARDTNCVAGTGVKSDSISFPLDSLSQLTIVEDKLDVTTTSAVTLLCVAAGVSMYVLATHKLTNL